MISNIWGSFSKGEERREEKRQKGRKRGESEEGKKKKHKGKKREMERKKKMILPRYDFGSLFKSGTGGTGKAFKINGTIYTPGYLVM